MLKLRDIEVRRGERVTLALDELHLEGDRFTVILGHNGSGKSTLMNLLARQLEPTRGSLQLDDQPLSRFSARDFARRVAFLPQHLPDVAGLTVRELVRLGRFPWRGLLGRWRAEDHAAVDQALAQTDVAHYAEQLADGLSGGERQRAWIAMLLAQHSPLLLLDEPTSALDLHRQIQLLSILRRLAKERGMLVIAALHDLGHALRFTDQALVLQNGTLVNCGPTEEVVTPELLYRVYHVTARIERCSKGRPQLIVEEAV